MSTEELIQSGVFDGVVVCGGDGSVNSAAETILKSGRDIPLGVIPNGTCNDFSRSLGMPSDIIKCAQIIAQGNITRTDIGFINGSENIFCKRAGGRRSGFRLVFNRPEHEKDVRPLAYYVTGLGELANVKPFELKIETDNETYVEQALVFAVLNGTDMSGFSNVIKEALMQDGEMDILIFKNSNPLEITDTLIKFVTGGDFREKKCCQDKNLALQDKL